MALLYVMNNLEVITDREIKELEEYYYSRQGIL